MHYANKTTSRVRLQICIYAWWEGGSHLKRKNGTNSIIITIQKFLVWNREKWKVVLLLVSVSDSLCKMCFYKLQHLSWKVAISKDKIISVENELNWNENYLRRCMHPVSLFFSGSHAAMSSRKRAHFSFLFPWTTFNWLLTWLDCF